jgi:hypothetical protein
MAGRQQGHILTDKGSARIRELFNAAMGKVSAHSRQLKARMMDIGCGLWTRMDGDFPA